MRSAPVYIWLACAGCFTKEGSHHMDIQWSQRVHRLQELRCDAAWHNMLLDANQQIMVIDFERSEPRKQQPLQQISIFVT